MSDPLGPIIPLLLEKSVLSVELIDLEERRKLVTFHREGRRCTFSEALNHKNFELTLRLDWGQLSDGEPTLDLDVVRVNADGSRKRLSPKRNPVHHTSLSSLLPGSTEPRVYDLTFEGLHLRLLAKKTFATSAGLSMFIVKQGAAADEA